MKTIRTADEFEIIWKETEALVCDFSASWCGPCRMLEPVLKKVEGENPGVRFVKIDVDEHDDISEKHRVEAMPTILSVRKGCQKHRRP